MSVLKNIIEKTDHTPNLANRISAGTSFIIPCVSAIHNTMVDTPAIEFSKVIEFRAPRHLTIKAVT